MHDRPPELSLVLITFEQEAFVRDALRSVLAQDCPPAEILVSDDCSQDQTYEILQEECDSYHGPHQVTLERNEQNLGSGNLMLTASKARGRYVVMFHGDDIAVPHRARHLLQLFKESRASLISSNAILLDATGKRGGQLLEKEPSGWVTLEQTIDGFTRRQLGATQAWARDVLSDFPNWQPEHFWGSSDQILPFRAALMGGAYYSNEPFVFWRQHAKNLGKETLDQTQSADITKETSAAHNIALRVRMQQELAEFQARRPDRTDLEPAALRLQQYIDTRLRDWAALRSRLNNSGYRKMWVPRQRMLARPQHGSTHRKAEKQTLTMQEMLKRTVARALRRLAAKIS